MREDLKALKSFTYAGRALQAGEKFSASRGDARALRAVRRAETYQTTATGPEVTKGAPAATAPAKKAAAKTTAKKTAPAKKAKASGK